jgi:hypothetical protein
MRLAKLAALVVPFTFVSCGGRSSPSAPTSALLDLVPGTYALTVTMSPNGDPTCTNGICTSLTLCIGSSDPRSVLAVTTAVRVDRAADAITIRPEDTSASFRMELRIAEAAVSGTASGQFRDGNGQLSIGSGDPQSRASVSGVVLATSVSGKIDGQVGVSGYSCSNNGHTWTLVSR